MMKNSIDSLLWLDNSLVSLRLYCISISGGLSTHTEIYTLDREKTQTKVHNSKERKLSDCLNLVLSTTIFVTAITVG